jgi:diguanylate cyclase (GGDEF)-like protein
MTRACATNLAHRVPLVYTVMIIDIAVLSVRFHGSAPPWLTVLVPLVMCALAVMRGIYWLPQLVEARSTEVQDRDLRRMSVFAGYAALSFTVWGLVLYQYGTQADRSLIQYIVAVSCYTAILGLGQSPRTSVTVALAAMIPSTLYFVFQDHPNAASIAVVQSVVTLLLVAVTNGYHRDFIRLELSRQQLARREREAAMLAESNRYNATVDPLTGALNRRAILARLEQEVSDDDRDPVWLALLDLDGFKHVNDTYGHAAGDTVLRAVSDRIAALPEVTAFGRLGGDEFAILLGGEHGVEAVCTALQGLSESVRQPIVHDGVSLRLAGSIGLRRTESRTVSECLERSDAALYKAKEKGDGAVVLFTDDDEVELKHRSAATRRFNDCQLEDRLRLVYQPMVDVDTRAVVGFEAFARWSPDGETWLTPSHFLSLAQATGRTGELTRLVLARALGECPAWEHGLDLAINLSPRDVMREGAPDVLAAIVREAGAPPEKLLLEVTERALHHDPRRAGEQLAKFRAMGFRIALDDFGAGWSSLSHVRNLPLDLLKIDRGLASAMATDPGARAIAGTIVGLAWQMGLECSIEGIEEARQAETARALGLRLMQGYHFGHPQPAGEALKLLAKAA